MEPIINPGRGSEIAGTRITVYDVLDYHRQGWHPSAIAATLRLSSAQVEAAIAYVEQHKEEVMAAYQRLLERSAQGNPPEVRARLDAIAARYEALWADRLARMNGEDRPVRH